MKIRSLLLILAALALPAIPVRAAQLFTGSDLVLNFGDGNSAHGNLVVDAGSMVQLSSGNTLSFDLSGVLSATYGADWYENTALLWNASATSLTPVTSGGVTVPGETFSTVSGNNPNTFSSTGIVVGIRGAITATDPASNLLGGTVRQLTDGSLMNGTAYQVDLSVTNNFWIKLKTYNPSAGTPPLFVDGGTSVTQLVSAGNNSFTMYGWDTTAFTVSQVGAWSLDTDPGSDTFGVLSFTPTADAVPEPSTYAMMAIAGGFFLLVLRVRALRAA